MRWPALCVGVLAACTEPAGAGDFVYTPARGSACKIRSVPSFSSWSCPGPAGYRAHFFDEGNVAGIGIGRERSRPRADYTWRATGEAFGSLVEWRMDLDRPRAATIRMRRALTDDLGEDREATELLVFRITDNAVCRLASIDVRVANANAIARAVMSDEQRICAKD